MREINNLKVTVCSNKKRQVFELKNSILIYIPLTTEEAKILGTGCADPALRIFKWKGDQE